MKPQTLEEFAQNLRTLATDSLTVDFAGEILELIDLTKIEDLYRDLCNDLQMYAPNDLGDKPEKAMEWLGDRSKLLEEIEEQLKEAGRTGDADDVVKELLGTLADAEKILEDHGWPGTDFLDALENLAESSPTPKEYDL